MRQAAGAANGTINRELGVLSKLLRVAFTNNKLIRRPALSFLKEAAPRQGFFEQEQFEAVRRRLPDDLRVVVTIAHTYGWRVPSEVLTLDRRQLDLDAGTLRLDPGTTKNDDGRIVYLTPELKALLAAQVARVEGLQRRRGTVIPALFPHLTGVHAGRRIRNFRKAWTHRVQGGRGGGTDAARSPAHRRPQPRAEWRAALVGHEDDGPPDGERLPAVRHCVRRRSPGSDTAPRGHKSGHNRGGWVRLGPACAKQIRGLGGRKSPSAQACQAPVLEPAPVSEPPPASPLVR